MSWWSCFVVSTDVYPNTCQGLATDVHTYTLQCSIGCWMLWFREGHIPSFLCYIQFMIEWPDLGEGRGGSAGAEVAIKGGTFVLNRIDRPGSRFNREVLHTSRWGGSKIPLSDQIADTPDKMTMQLLLHSNPSFFCLWHIFKYQRSDLWFTWCT